MQAPSHLLRFHFQILRALGFLLSIRHRMPLPRIWKSRRLSLRSPQFAEENITQISFRVIVVQGLEKTIGLDVERSGTVDDVKSKILKEMGISKDM